MPYDFGNLAKPIDNSQPAVSQYDFGDLATPTVNLNPTGIDKIKAMGQSFLAGVEDPISGGAQLLTHVLPQPVVNAGNQLNNFIAKKTGLLPTIPKGGLDKLLRQRQDQLAAARAKAGLTGFDWARVAGNIVPYAFAPELAIEGGLGARMGVGAVTGGLQGALQPTNDPNYWTGKGEQVLAGALGGAIAPGATNSLAAVVRGVKNPAVQALRKAGVSMTPGQVIGGPVRAAEEKLASIPLVGDLIKSAERRGVVGFNRAAVDESLAPIGVKLPKNVPVGHDSIEWAGQQLSSRYDDLLPKLKARLDPRFVSDMAKIRSLGQTLPKDRANQLDAFIKQDVLARFNPQTGQALGHTVKDIESKLGNEARSYMRSADPDQRKLGAALQEVQISMRRMLERNNPQYKGQLAKLNSAYAKFMRVENAAGRTGADEGIFTASQLRQATRQLDLSRNKRAFARGKANMQEFAEQGKKVLANKVPDSGTAGRAMLGAAALAGPGAWHPMLGAGAIAAPFYTPLGQRLFTAAAAARPESANALAALLQRQYPALSGAAAAGATQLLPR